MKLTTAGLMCNFSNIHTDLIAPFKCPVSFSAKYSITIYKKRSVLKILLNKLIRIFLQDSLVQRVLTCKGNVSKLACLRTILGF